MYLSWTVTINLSTACNLKMRDIIKAMQLFLHEETRHVDIHSIIPGRGYGKRIVTASVNGPGMTSGSF